MSYLRKIAGASLVSLAFASGAASAAPIVLDFEGVGNLASVNDFYNGGTDSAGNSGANYGINFSGTSLAIIDADAGGSGNFGNEPSPSTILFFQSGGAATMNVAAGFDTGFSFYYTASQGGFVNVYDGLNGTGNLLASLDLAANIGNCSGDPSGTFCTFSPIGVSFAGIAHSVDFGGAANFIGFDNITLGASNPGNPGEVPEPATLALAALGLAAMRASRRKTGK
ncbi:MAG TPA: PEP-CTERM sorting domain-containing protein [Massilia sp.]|nr:PEP-CTERM sorting domain-containing protein [Massilia sp.]